MKAVLVALLLAPAAADLTFAEFKAKWNKVYSTVEEEEARAEVYKMNIEKLIEMKASMSEEEASVFGVTKFYDRTPDEFRRSHLNYRPVAAEKEDIPLRNHTGLTGRKPQSVVDWHARGATTDVKDQGYCGSCWAFSAVEQIESAWYLAGNDLTILSTQQLVSCDNVDAGCNGGDSPTAYSYVKRNGGVTTDEIYPYTDSRGRTSSCDSTKEKTDLTAAVKGYEYVSTKCTSRRCDSVVDEDMLKSALDEAPASICVNAARWNSYTGGVMKASACGGSGFYDLDHCVQLIGYNAGASTPYWIVRNSWNTDWGEDGNIYLAIGDNTCGVADEAMTVTF